jgi:hypothetical protein
MGQPTQITKDKLMTTSRLSALMRIDSRILLMKLCLWLIVFLRAENMMSQSSEDIIKSMGNDDPLIKQIEAKNKAFQNQMNAEINEITKWQTMHNPEIFQSELEELQKQTWSAGDYRECQNVIYCVWDSSWTTIFGSVEEGRRGIVVKGFEFDFSASYPTPVDYNTTRLNFLVHGNVMVGNPPHAPVKGDYILLRVKDMSEERELANEQAGTSAGKVRVVDFGYARNEPPNAKETSDNIKYWRETKFNLALERMKKILNDAIAKREPYLRAKKLQEQAAQDKLRAEAAHKAELEDKLFQADIENATNGVESSQYRLGMRFLNGDGVPKDESVGKQWLDKASAQGNLGAKTALAALAYKINLNDSVIMAEVKYAMQDADSYQYKLGLRFLNGDGVTQNKQFAKEWLEKAARNGNADAKTALSTLSP